MRVLLIEDDKKLSAAIAKNLKAEGIIVDCAFDGLTGEEYASVDEHDVILLDILLPRQNGWTTCGNLRKAGVLTPILMLTALDQVEDKIRGLDGGADDYLAKPFHIGELLARIRLLARRRTTVRSATVERHGLVLDTAAHTVARDGTPISLTAKEFALLELFVMHPGALITRQMIIDHLWDMNFEPRSNVVEAFVRLLRKKIDRGYSVKLIHTIRGAGYVFSNQEPQ